MPGGISPWSLLVILAIVLLIFGTKRLRNMGGDLGGALKNFRSAMKDGEKDGENGHDKDADDKTKGPMDPQRLNRDEPEIEGTITGKKIEKAED